MHIYPTSLNSLHLQWNELEGDTFDVQRSTSPDDDYEIIATGLTNPVFTDQDVNLFKVGLIYYYKVTGYIGGVKTSEVVGESARYNNPDGVANKAIWENQLALRVMKNPDVFILLKSRDNKPCSECFNSITKKPKFANCKKCNGTGFMHGYHTPIRTKISRDFSQILEYSNEIDGEKNSLSIVNAWITNKPLLAPGDVIVDCMNQRFLVEAVMPRTRSQFVIRQVLNLIPLEKGHTAYQVEVKFHEL